MGDYEWVGDKTECGIHVAGAEKTFDRDLWDGKSSVQTLATEEDVATLKASGKDATGMPVYKFRGDEQREFVEANLNTSSFPTINYVGADGKPIKYESEVRTVEAMADFAKSGGKMPASA